MPILTDLNVKEAWIEPDEVPRPIIAFGVTGLTTGVELHRHSHRKAQLLLLLSGVLMCEVDSGLWLVPPQSAFWIPGDAMHALKASGCIEGYNVFLDPSITRHLPTAACTVSVTPLMRELLIRAASFPLLYPEGGAETHLFTLLLDEIAAAKVGSLHLPMPQDSRLRMVAEMMLADPADRGTMETWARYSGIGERTFARLLVKETGMTFGRWRQQLCIVHALQKMADGVSIQQVAYELGYDSAASFITMFRKTLGVPPGRYMTNLKGQPDPDVGLQ
ncbi:helix-turn-helix transcriptional regulator [Asticcacaulis sp. 201]|uniref:AraC family transcriptional regulator n=1 Tax=Asticcacaulis sp. 201 TaxID=3028787 RepID=UPI002916B3B1|nr:helix-turn-helix transcriptional regulator [Asticcacaulis sp. 201]MDV6329989.1 helix-turn-helix transcriptional regulator [Asticcacaulis sp. 201]